MNKFEYPHTHAIDHFDEYHGTQVHDPYRWLEDTDSPETKNWIETQNNLTFSFLESIPARERIRQRLTEIWDFPRIYAPRPRGERFFQMRNSGLQNQDALYVMESYSEDGRLLLDPNTLSQDGTVALNDWYVSGDGRWLAYGASSSGSDWVTWRVRNVDSGEDLPDRIEWSKFSSAAWLPDGRGFYYSRYDPPAAGQEFAAANYDQKLYFHRRGTAQDEDKLVYSRPDQPEWGYAPEVSRDGHYLVLTVWQGTDIRNRLFYLDLQSGGSFTELIPSLEAEFQFVGSKGSRLFLLTDLDSPRRRLVVIDLEHPQREAWQTVIPESSDTLQAVKIVHNELVALYLHDAHHLLKRYSMDGELLGEVPLPSLGALFELGYKLEMYGDETGDDLFFTFQSFTIPPSVYRYHFTSGEVSLVYSPPIQFDFSPYVTQQGFVRSEDGAQIPLFVVHRNDMPHDGKNPTLLYGYGGFAIPLTPIFSISRLAWLELGGVLAYACLRGGGEYGEEWHKAGMLQNKQNVFDDFIACAEHLIEAKITSAQRLAIQGRSNGGLLVGACMTQRPDLFGACLPGVGVMDMLRFHKFTIGWGWVSDYGSSDVPEQFKALYAYSPYHNLKPGVSYPATLVTTGDHDDRVVPGHSFKFAAALQATHSGTAPVLIRIQTKAGHGYGKPTAILISEEADNWAFLVKCLNITQGYAQYIPS